VRGVTDTGPALRPMTRTFEMCFVDCPVCDQPVASDPGDDEFDCPACGVASVVGETPVELLLAA